MNNKRRLPKRLLLHQEVGQYIKEAILSGELKPGERIVETRLAQDLGVSQAPVREAIRELEFSGLIEQKPYMGTFVKKIELQDIRQFYEIRSALEKVGAECACDAMSDEQCEELGHILFAMEESARDRDVSRYVKEDALFHDKIIESADNDLLCKLWEQCNIRAWLFVGTNLAGHDLPYLASRHRLIYENLLARNKEKLRTSVEAHLKELLTMMEKREILIRDGENRVPIRERQNDAE